MEQERFQSLSERYVAGTLTEAEAQELLRALQGSPELRGILRAQTSMDLALRQRFEEKPQRFSRRVIAALRDPAQKEGVVTRIMFDLGKQLNPSGMSSVHTPVFFPTRRHRNLFILATAAAAMLVLGVLAVAALGYLSKPGGDGSGSAHLAAVASARLEKGSASVRRGSETLALGGTFALRASDVLATGADGVVTVEYPDHTSLRVAEGTELRFQPGEFLTAAQIGVGLESGRIEASVSPQPAGAPMVVVTPQARATILGTRFELTVGGGESRLTVMEGSIKYAHASRNETVTVSRDQSAVAAAEMRLDSTAATRDPAYWPFSATSPWNYPLGSKALYAAIESPHFESAQGIDFLTGEMSLPVAIATSDDPQRQLLRGTPEKTKVLKVRIPENAMPEPSGAAYFDLIDERHWRVVEMLGAELRSDGSIFVQDAHPIILKDSGVFAPGRRNTRVYGGAALGGVIRKGELSGGIRHALAGLVCMGALNAHAPGGTAYVWPASNALADAETKYGKIGNLYLGTLLALPPDLDIRTLGVGESGAAYEVAKALQDYGLYVTDHAEKPKRDLGLICEFGSGAEIPADLPERMALVMRHLKTVSNNGPQNVGGGGVRRRAFAPPFAPEFDRKGPDEKQF